MKLDINKSTEIYKNSIYNFLIGLGPAAITSLLVTSVWSEINNLHSDIFRSTFVVLLSLSVITIIKKIVGGIIFPMLIGICTYGLLYFFIIQ